ncbi:hypothetical protein AVEN_42218-1 [Araneus ventricosus]|uniref:Uncharacterized protein n=1 Tax=Araneus ventricosus TaxID=182803 RepID=A0A4Y2B0I6_ARAVE|nr:hypothetical protein AVEN_42218-1 [Araneus ventricosus]
MRIRICTLFHRAPKVNTLLHVSLVYQEYFTEFSGFMWFYSMGLGKKLEGEEDKKRKKIESNPSGTSPHSSLIPVPIYDPAEAIPKKQLFTPSPSLPVHKFRTPSYRRGLRGPLSRLHPIREGPYAKLSILHKFGWIVELRSDNPIHLYRDDIRFAGPPSGALHFLGKPRIPSHLPHAPTPVGLIYGPAVQTEGWISGPVGYPTFRSVPLQF